ncbi:hypothetical protein ACUXQ2_005695 [Cupriavidus metallidurans]|uniref:hypothetical protein n=1 Tax=Cupriavidus metallidurans TaxID=119219 RepID=UPI000AD19AB6|nr:hypothetical protein [Cupriavidus metallidurans]
MAVVLVAALTRFVAFSDTTGLRNQAFSEAASQLAAQANFIRTRILLCGSDFPDGNNATGYRPALPAGTPSVAASTLICPGTGQNLWAGTDGVSLPPAPKYMGGVWQYANDATNVRIGILGDVGVLNQAALRLGADATVSAGALYYKVSN